MNAHLQINFVVVPEVNIPCMWQVYYTGLAKVAKNTAPVDTA
jgi:hypothetical protein